MMKMMTKKRHIVHDKIDRMIFEFLGNLTLVIYIYICNIRTTILNNK